MKILIIGIVASGKTTLAKKLEQQLNIKHYEIDSIVHDDLYKWTSDYEKEREKTINKYADKLIKIRNSKEWEECIKNEYSKT